MKCVMFLVASLVLCSASAQGNDRVEISGKLEISVACNENYHEVASFIIEPGKDKFSGIRHRVSIPANLKQKLGPSAKIKIKGRKQAAVKKRMTKGEIRKEMVKYLTKREGVGVYTKDIEKIVKKIQVKAGSKDSNKKHDHGDLKLQSVDDDDEVVEVTIPAHIVVENIEIIK